jgi:hypothetical protein
MLEIDEFYYLYFTMTYGGSIRTGSRIPAAGTRFQKVVRKTRINANYEARISHIRSDFSRFSGATVNGSHSSAISVNQDTLLATSGMPNFAPGSRAAIAREREPFL